MSLRNAVGVTVSAAAIFGLAACAAQNHSRAVSPLNDGAVAPDRVADAATVVDLAVPPSSFSPTYFGAVPFSGGTHFRVWAPAADSVFVAGDWNHFSQTQDQLTRQSDDTFTGDVAAAHAGAQYEFIVLHGTDTLVRADPRGQQMVSASGKNIIYDDHAYAWTTGDFRAQPFAKQVIYELHVGSFTVNPSTNATPGTWTSAQAKLDYLQKLGVNMVEVLPIAEFPQALSWGYGPTSPYAVATSYGTPDQVKAFIDAAHARNIGVIVDTVHNHYGGNKSLVLTCFDGACTTPWGVYFFTNGFMTTPWGPRPAYDLAPVTDFILSNAAMWLTSYRADGLRWDSVLNIRSSNGVIIPSGVALLGALNDAVDHAQPWKIQIAEDLQADAAITQATAQGGLGFDSQWDAGFINPLVAQLEVTADASVDLNQVRASLTNQFNATATQRIIYTENHDTVGNGATRLPDTIDPANPSSLTARKKSTLGASLLMTTPGVPMLFMGQEFLTHGSFDTMPPLDWTAAQTNAPILQMYTDLIALRRNLAGNTAGLAGNSVNVFHQNDAAKVIAYHRYDVGGVGDDVVVLANFSGHAFASYQIGFPRAGTWHVRFNGDATRYGSDFGGTVAADVVTRAGTQDGFANVGSVGVGAYSIVILTQ